MKKQNKNKGNNIKNKIILPLATVFSASSIALVSLVNTTQNINNNETSLFANNISSNNKSISSNAIQKNNLIGPHELFYLSKKLDSSVNVWNDTSNSEDTTNYNSWSSFKNNIAAVSGSSSIKDELVTIANQVLNVKNIKSIYKEFDNLKQQNSWMTDEMVQSLKDAIKNQTGYVESMSEIIGIDEIPSKLLSLSGIEEGTKISSLTTVGNNNSSMLTTDLSTTSSGTAANINSVAGADFTYLAKIAEIDPTVEGNYALTFGWKKSASSSTINGTLFINNTKDKDNNLPLNQNKDNIDQLFSSLDVFGRWNLGTNGTLGTGNYDKEFENFVIQKGTSASGQEVIEVLVRLKANQTISNIQWGTDITVPGALNLKQGLRFGILDVQANDKNTFKSAILGTFTKDASQSQYPTTGKLIDNSDNIKKVSFFSDTLTSKKIVTSKETQANRSLTFWQYGNLDLSLPLYYAVGSESDIANNTITYNPISIYSNGSPTSAQQTIMLNSTDNAATTISPNTYSMFSDLKNKLPENVKNDFVSSSKITLTSSLYTTQKVTKQELKFYDNFYAIGNRDEGWNSISVNGDIKFIKIQDPTQKIFFENPFPDAITTYADPTVLTSTVNAQETINERTTVIGFLGNIYEQFSKSNSGDLTGENYSNLVYGKWVPKGSNSSNIVYESATFNGSPNQLYSLLNNTWKAIRPAMDKLFGITTKDDRYDVTKQPPSTIVNSYLAFISEFTADSSKLESLITEAITKVKAEISNITEQTKYEGLSTELKKSLGQIMAKLIQLQLDTISNEFQLRLSTPLYNAIKNVILNEENKVSFTIQDPTSFLEVFTSESSKKLIKYSNDGWNKIVQNGESSLKNNIQKMLNILYFNNSNNSTTVYLGNSIFNTGNLETLFNSYSASSLTTFVSDTYQTQNEKVEFYGKLFSIFTNYNMQNKVQEMLRTGTAVSINESEIISVFKDVLLKITNQIQRTENIKEESVHSYYLDDLISGANAIITLKWKLDQLSTNFMSAKATISQNEINDINQNIQNILNSNEQISSSELSIWSNIILGSFNYSDYTQNLSGRNGNDALMSMVDKIADNNTLLTPRAQQTIPAIIVLEYLIKYIWWPTLALIGLGIIVSSSIGLATKDRKVKLSARPIVKWLLIASVILGLGVLTLSILLGLPTLGLPAIL